MKKEEIELIIKLYDEGKSIYSIKKENKFSSSNIRYWIIKNGRKIRNENGKGTRKIGDNEIKIIIEEYSKLKSMKGVSNKTGFPVSTIKYWLLKNNIKIISRNPKRGDFSKNEIKKIITLYVEEKRGAKYIGKLYGRSANTITYWLDKWKIPKNSRSEISLKIREVYGNTKGFSGKSHSKESKEMISQSGKEAWERGDKIPTIGKSRTYYTKFGKALGTYEVAYLQKLTEENKEIPKGVKKRYKTPFGTYMPDFEYNDRFIEIKSKFTLDVAKGIQPLTNGNYSNNQWKKINWLNENVKTVEIIVVDNDEAKKYFKMAKNKNNILNE